MAIEVDGNKIKTDSKPRPKLAHASLHNISPTVRFFVAGFLSNVLFLTTYNIMVESFANHETFPASRIYSILYCCWIPIGHAITCSTVFGWPKQYFNSLMSNVPIGLAAMSIGTFLTGYLDRIHFDHKVEAFFGQSHPYYEGETGEFYSSLVVTVVTGIFSYLASSYVNASPASDGGGTGGEYKKEL